MYRVTVGGENAGLCVATLDEAKTWVERHNPLIDCVVWFGKAGELDIAAIYRNGAWS